MKSKRDPYVSTILAIGKMSNKETYDQKLRIGMRRLVHIPSDTNL